MRRKSRASTKRSTAPQTDTCRHPQAGYPHRPDVGIQVQFPKKLFSVQYRRDSSLSTALDWDGQNPTWDQGNATIQEIIEADSLEKAEAAAEKLRGIAKQTHPIPNRHRKTHGSSGLGH